MIWIDDLAALEPRFLREGLRLQENGISPERFALALVRARPATRAYVLRYLESELSAAVDAALADAAQANQATIFEAQLEVVVLHYWPMVYRRFPKEYERFVSCQRYRFDRVFPPAQYAGSAVLDIGCGTGTLADHLSHVAGRIVGIDPVLGMLSIARTKYRGSRTVHFAAGSFQHIPLPDGAVDFIVSNMAFQFHESWGGEAGLRNMARVLRPGGGIRMTVGDIRTQDFLLANGFTEKFVPHGLTYVEPPADASPLLKHLLLLAKRGSRPAATKAAPARHYLSAATGWWPSATLSNLWEVAKGANWTSMFHEGLPWAPAGLPVYTWTKMSLR
jgi:ubiquinone/menaquinone biosynthesis C-methylase UbiE